LRNLLLIIAGAGSGKTLTVCKQIAYLIEKGVKPENILALAFNQKAAEELKERGHRYFGKFRGSKHIITFHFFCNQVIQDNISTLNLTLTLK